VLKGRSIIALAALIQVAAFAANITAGLLALPGFHRGG
jgi:hypothetical protein